MATPEKYSSFHHLKSVISKLHNLAVRRYFKDVKQSPDKLSVKKGRQSLYRACLIAKNDTASMIIIRIFVYYFFLRKAQDLQTPIYGMPLNDVQASRKFKPQITLKFRENLSDVEEGNQPTWGEISFRLMNESSETITEAELKKLAKNIQRIFGKSIPYVWKKGKKMYSYTDKDLGYQLQLLCRSDTEAYQLIEAILDIQSHKPQWEKVGNRQTGKSSSDELKAYPYTSKKIKILNKTKREPIRRPNVDVVFMWAECHLWANGKPIILFDRTNSKINSLVTASDD